VVRRKALAAFLLGEQLLSEKFQGASSEKKPSFTIKKSQIMAIFFAEPSEPQVKSVPEKGN